MNQYLAPLLLALAVLAAPAHATASHDRPAHLHRKPTPETYQVQPQLSSLGWVAKKVTGQHNGSIQFKEGQVLVQAGRIVGGTFVVDMATLKDEDMTNAEAAARLSNHIKSDDFFGVEKYPTSTFVITGITPLSGDAAGNNATVTGNLTIKGKTNPLSFPAQVGVKGGVAAASGTATIDRTQYDIRYRSKSFFESIGDKAIDDTFTLRFNVIAKPGGMAQR